MKTTKSKVLQKLGALAAISILAIGCGDSNDTAVQPAAESGPTNAVIVALNNGGNNVASYGVNDFSSGALTPVIGTQATVSSPAELVLRQNTAPGTGVRGYYTNLDDSSINTFDIDQTTGSFLPLPPAANAFATTVPGAFGVALDNSQTFLYVVGDGQVDAYNVTADPVTQVPGFPVTFDGPANGIGFINRVKISPNNQFLFATDQFNSSVAAFTRDQTTGALTQVPGSPFEIGPNGATISADDALEISSDGNFLYLAGSNGRIAGFRVTPTTGVLVPLAPAIGLTHNGAARADTNACGMFIRGNTLYISDSAQNTTDAFTVAADGQLTQVAGFPVNGGGCGAISTSSDPAAPVYLAGFNFDQILGFIPGANGALTGIAGSPVATGAGSNPASLGVIVR